MDAVEAAFAATPREAFLPESAQSRAADDWPLPIGHGQTCSQPRTVEDLLRLLAVEPGQHVLDVGAGSGWTTALIAHLTGPAGTVFGVEIEPDLATWGAANLAATGRSWASLRAATPGVLGDPLHAPYDRILVSADARVLPPTLVDQLADRGRLVVPVRGALILAVKSGDDVRTSVHGYYRFVPLRDRIR